MCDIVDMSDILTIRLPAEEKARWRRAASAVKESLAEYVRKAVIQRTESTAVSPWDKYLGAADVSVPPPTNVNVRRAFAQRRPKR